MQNVYSIRAILIVTASLLLAAVAPQFSSARAQGSLTPPGAPAPTFKTLGQVEPRIPISIFQTNLTVPGSYYLTTNLFAGTNNLDGINIRTNINNITIDLNGFSIIATNPPSAFSPVGIRTSQATNIVIRNGQITGFDRGIRIEGGYGVIVENVHCSNMTRSGIEASGDAATLVQTTTIRNCVVEDVNSTGKPGTVSADGIVLVNCTGVVDNCVVRHIFAAGAAISTCINVSGATNSFINNNFMGQADVGLNVSGGGTRVYYRNNLTAGCPTPFSINGGVDRGGNN